MPEQFDQEAQDIYAELRRRGVHKSDPEAGAILQELVKRGVLHDLSGGSVPSSSAPKAPSVGMGDLRAYERDSAPAKAPLITSAPSISQYVIPGQSSPAPAAPRITSRTPGLRPTETISAAPKRPEWLSSAIDLGTRLYSGGQDLLDTLGGKWADNAPATTAGDWVGNLVTGLVKAPVTIATLPMQAGLSLGKLATDTATQSAMQKDLRARGMVPEANAQQRQANKEAFTTAAGFAVPAAGELSEAIFGSPDQAWQQLRTRAATDPASFLFDAAALVGLAHGAKAGAKAAPELASRVSDVAQQPRRNQAQRAEALQTVQQAFAPIKARVTDYGSPNPKIETTPDTNSLNGIGAFPHSSKPGSLKEGYSFALSPDKEAQFRAAGIKPGDEVSLKLADGRTVQGRWDDRTSAALTGRIDFYSPSGVSPLRDARVVGVAKGGAPVESLSSMPLPPRRGTSEAVAVPESLASMEPPPSRMADTPLAQQEVPPPLSERLRSKQGAASDALRGFKPQEATAPTRTPIETPQYDSLSLMHSDPQEFGMPEYTPAGEGNPKTADAPAKEPWGSDLIGYIKSHSDGSDMAPERAAYASFPKNVSAPDIQDIYLKAKSDAESSFLNLRNDKTAEATARDRFFRARMGTARALLEAINNRVGAFGSPEDPIRISYPEGYKTPREEHTERMDAILHPATRTPIDIPNYDSLAAMHSATPETSMPEYTPAGEGRARQEQVAEPVKGQKEPWEMTEQEFSQSSHANKFKYIESEDNLYIRNYIKSASRSSKPTRGAWLSKAVEDSFYGTPTVRANAKLALDSVGIKTGPLGGALKGRIITNGREAVIENAKKDGRLSASAPRPAESTPEPVRPFRALENDTEHEYLGKNAQGEDVWKSPEATRVVYGSGGFESTTGRKYIGLPNEAQPESHRVVQAPEQGAKPNAESIRNLEAAGGVYSRPAESTKAGEAPAPKKAIAATKRAELQAAKEQAAADLKKAAGKTLGNSYTTILPPPEILEAGGRWIAAEVGLRHLDATEALKSKADAINTLASEFGDWVKDHADAFLEAARKAWHGDIAQEFSTEGKPVPAWLEEGEGAQPSASEPIAAPEAAQKPTEAIAPKPEPKAFTPEPPTSAPEPTAAPDHPARKLLKIETQDEIMREMGMEPNPERGGGVRTFADRFKAASDNWDAIRTSLDARAASDKPGILSDEERIVALSVQREARDKYRALLDKRSLTPQERGELVAAQAQAYQMHKLITDTGSELGRGLGFGRALIDDTPGGFMKAVERAQGTAEGKLSQQAMEDLARLARTGEKRLEEVNQAIEQKAAASVEQAREQVAAPKRYKRSAASPKSAEWGKDNEVFTRAKYEAALAKLKQSNNPTRRGATAPSPLAGWAGDFGALVDIGGYHFEAGLRKFGDWARQVREDVGDVPDSVLGRAWNEVSSRKFRTPEQVEKVANERLQGIIDTGKPSAPRAKGQNPLLDVATAEYAKGARSLEAWARGVEKRLGTTLPEDVRSELYREAARQYATKSIPVQKVKEQLARRIEAEVLKTQPKWAQTARQLNDIRGKVTTFIATYDLSYLGRQGGRIGAAHPVIWAKGLREGLRTFKNPELAHAMDGQIKAEAGLYGDEDHWKKIGLEFPGVGEEENMAGIHADGPIWNTLKKTGIERSEEANRTLLNMMRLEMFKKIVPVGAPLEAQKAVAQMINVWSGRGDFGQGNTRRISTALAAASQWLGVWSPRNNVANVQFMLGQPLAKSLVGAVGSTTPEARAANRQATKIIAQQYARYAISVGATVGLLKTLSDYLDDKSFKVETNPRSPDFGKVKIGNNEIDLTSGWRKHWAYGNELAGMRQESAFEPTTPKKPRTWRPPDRAATLTRYGRSMLNPVAGEAVNVVVGRDFKGSPVKVAGLKNGSPFFDAAEAAKRAATTFVPIPAQGWVQALVDGGLTPGAARDLAIAMPIDAVGLGVSTRDRTVAAKQKEQNKAAAKGFTPIADSLSYLLNGSPKKK